VTGVQTCALPIYLQALGLRPAALMRAMGMSFCMATLALAVGLHRDAALPPATLLTSGLMLAPALAGMALGQHLAARWSPAGFRRALMIGLGGLGLAMLVR
jgi:uncharacterized membrane protein YfcA